MKNNTLIKNSMLYRCTQKYYDKVLREFDIGAAQMTYLIMIYENEGLSMQDLANLGSFDKGTITKGIQKLEENGYITLIPNENDKRIKCLYTTQKARDIIAKIYMIRNEWWEHITSGLSLEEIDMFISLQDKIAMNALALQEDNEEKIRFFGMQKLTLLDYPGKVGCTLFTGGCNFRCPFCQNSDLVFLKEDSVEIPKDKISEFLKKRKNILEGVCITGGEPLLHPGLENYLKEIKSLGYHIKLDTNGSLPGKLKHLIKLNLIDYVAMDIKNSPSQYNKTIGVDDITLSSIKESIDYLKENHISYEFRTTIVKEFHNEESIKEMGEWIKGAKILYLQNFEDSEHVIMTGLHSHSKDMLFRFKDILSEYVDEVILRGIE